MRARADTLRPPAVLPAAGGWARIGNDDTRTREHTLNVWLAEELKRQGLDAVAERPAQRRRVDVKVILQRTRGGAEVVVAVEAEQGQNPSNMAEAVRDAEARLPGRQNLARCAVALCYPDLTTPESLPTAQLMWTVRDGQADAGARTPPAHRGKGAMWKRWPRRYAWRRPSWAIRTGRRLPCPAAWTPP